MRARSWTSSQHCLFRRWSNRVHAIRVQGYFLKRSCSCTNLPVFCSKKREKEYERIETKSSGLPVNF
ncbi:hypothetical protein DUNSADRAFT_12401 [Dunaliella salina]|uniref:Encoded protein n=1 Tax=Dunaliella salina TaxID=3046 RepID=A0ABQ7GBB9_DUNSA|nr:hypothetical protein DUNSADRAFT_12401 [Dunaliella salina]|eukprot:KAF5831914.1 hypothetical protein DUNSADRAFT_12401 [Dunaliella salina]